MTIATGELSPFSEWYSLRDELVPFIGERVFDLFALAICDETHNASVGDYFRGVLVDSGNDVVNPQLTETEQLLIEWARAVSRDSASVDAALRERFDRAFRPQLRRLLASFAALMIATSIVASVS
jgi:hypothetical protein